MKLEKILLENKFDYDKLVTSHEIFDKKSIVISVDRRNQRTEKIR